MCADVGDTSAVRGGKGLIVAGAAGVGSWARVFFGV
jgi:hypothetical protein